MKRRTRGKRNRSKTRNRTTSSRKYISPRTLEEFYAMPRKMHQLYLNFLELIVMMRQGISRAGGMDELGLTRAPVEGFGGGVFQKLKNGRYAAKVYDHLLRVLRVVSNDGIVEVATLDSRQASKAGKHSAAVLRYFQTGDDAALRQFEGQYIIDAAGKKIPLLTDLEELDELGNAGVLSFETIYARNS